jgi:lipoprotein-anchoring transpeptidase ErfK/SrfK
MRSRADGPVVLQGTAGRAVRGARKPGPPRTARCAGAVVLAVACLTSRTRAQAPEESGPAAAGTVAARDTVPRHAFHSRADSLAWSRARADARAATGLHVVVSLGDHHLWVLYDDDTLRSARAAVASGLTIDYEGRTWTFRTPRGRHTVLRKERDPVWRPPDWLYAETALDYGLALARLDPRRPVRLANGARLEVQGGVVGLKEPGSGRFAALPVDEHIVFGDTLYIPPFATRNRHVRGELGRYALDLGDGYLIHGTPDHDSIGRAVTHGCIRLGDADIKWLYTFVPVGTPVYIY